MTHKTITNSARGQQCTVRLPSICNHDKSTTVFAHLNGVRHGHGVGIKTLFGAYACSACHDFVDGRTPNKWVSKDYLRAAHLDGVIETMGYILRNEPELWKRFLNE